MRFLILLILIFSTNLYGQVQYDIFLLARPGKESIEGVKSPRVNEAGQVIGIVEDAPFIYTSDSDFKVLPGQHSAHLNDRGQVALIDKNNGVTVFNIETGEYKNVPSVLTDQPFFPRSVFIDNSNRIFITGETYPADMIDLPYTDVSLLRPFSFGYDLNKEIFFFNKEGRIIDINSKGETIIGKEEEPEIERFDFFDFNEDKHIGSDGLGFNRVIPRFISDTGYVVGYASSPDVPYSFFLWHKEQGLLSLTRDGNSEIEVSDINDKGQYTGMIVREKRVNNQPRIYETYVHGFLYDRSRGLISIKPFKKDVSCEPRALNNLGQVVGISTYKTPFTVVNGHRGTHTVIMRAFLWDSAHGIQDLNTLIPQNSGWDRLEEATSINDKGWIVGVGVYQGVSHSFLLKPR